jgi:hypothetical protein
MTGRFGGKLLVGTRKMIEGSHRMEAYQDTWQDSVDIEYDGELTPAVTLAICEAWKNSGRLGTNQSGYGALRWSNADTILGVDIVKRQLRLGCSVSICD